MKTCYQIVRALVVESYLLVLIIIALLLAFTTPASAQIGTYVTPRPYVLWSGTLTNGQTVTPANLTNQLNYSGFHRLGLVLTLGSTNAFVGTSNVVVTVNVSSGTGNGYYNGVYGTNLVFTTTGPIAWTNSWSGAATNVYFANFDWNYVDNVSQFSFTLKNSSTNVPPAFGQLDAILTP